MKKQIILLLGLVSILGFNSCVKADLPGSDNAASSEKSTESKVSLDDMKMADAIDINFAMGNNARTLTYQKSMPLTLPDGSVITQGDLKPTWQYFEKQLGINFNDVTVQDQKGKDMIDIAAATGFSQATVYGGQAVANQLMDYGSQGYLVNLKDYMDYMPDIKAYMEANPNVAKSITAYDGGIYHIPYVAEIDNYARVFNARPDWVMALLDSDDALETESHTLSVQYKGYWDRHDSNVVDLQNEAAAGGVLDRDTALNVMKKYIASTYPGLAKPSDLFLGLTAEYDIDELVALWRIVELSPRTLSKVSTGSVVEDAEISPYFLRKSKYREELFRFITYFDGLRVFGSDTDQHRLWADNDGHVTYSYADPAFLEKMEYLKQWYAEGLIHSEFADESVKDEYRKSMYFSDAVEGQRQFGFMTIDWIASTNAGSPKIASVLPPVTTISKAGINEFIHYIENTRVIKPDGWSISVKASEEERNAALALFNYMFTEEGNTAQIYSIPDVLVDGEVFTGPDGTEYPKFNQWVYDAAEEYKNGDFSGFLRDFMGSLLALGYQKNMGFELQYTTPNGIASWELYTKAGVVSQSYGADQTIMRLMPPSFSLTEQEFAKVNTTSVGDEQIEKMLIYIHGGDVVERALDFVDVYKEAGIDTYVDVYNSAYKRMVGE